MDADAQMAKVNSDEYIANMVNDFVQKFERLDLKKQHAQEAVPVSPVKIETRVVSGHNKKNFLSMCNILLQLALIVLLSMLCFSVVLMHSPAAEAAAPTIVNHRKSADVAAPTIVHELKRVSKVVPDVLEPKVVEPVNVMLLTKRSIFLSNKALRPKVTHIMPVQAVAATAFEGALQMSAAVVTVTNHVDAKVTTHVAVPVETYTQWMLFMQSMSLVKPVKKIKTSAPPPPCVCPRDDEKHGNKTSSDVAVESTGAIVFKGVRFAMELVGTAFVVFVVIGAIAGTGVGYE